ncbi:MAG: hypothetical protein E7132_05645 [Rikenellaceae bacterium]|nr:hypothetical protein [Rikenellaceae bacterium]
MRYFFLSALVAVAGLFTACVEDTEIAPGEFAEGPQVHFLSDATTDFTLTAEDEAVEIPVVRVETEGSIEVPVMAVVAEEDVELFTVPTSVVFADGVADSSIEVAFDRASMEDGKSYSVTLTLDDPTMTTPYGASSVVLNFTVPEPYVLLGKGLIRDDIIATIFDVDNVEWEVEIYENTNMPGYIFLKNAYTSLYPYNEPGDYVTEDKYFIVNIADPNKVVIPNQALGMDWNPTDYGEFIVGTAAYGTLKNGVITFPVKGLLVGMMIYTEGGFGWYANTNGLFRIALPGAVLTDFSLEAQAAGHVANQAGQASPVINVTAGADVAAVGVQFVAGDVTADYASVVEAIVAEPELTNVVEGACTVVGQPMEAGQVTAVVVPFDANGVAQVEDAIAVAFYFAGCGAEAPACELEAYLFPYTQFWDADEKYSDANSVAIGLMGTEIKLCSFSLWDTESFDMYTAAGYGLDAFVDPDPNSEDAVPAEYIDGYINTDGLVMSFRGLPSEMEFILVAWAQNVYGSETYVTSNRLSTTAAAAAASAKAKFNGQGMLKSMQRVDLKLTWTKHEIK